MARVSGTPRKVTIDGLTYDVTGDADITINSPTEKEGMPTSGRSMMKVTGKSPDIESVTISASPEEHEVLMQVHERLDSVPMSVTFADGSVYRAVGHINLESYTSADNIATLK